ncbi:MAG: PAS domain S-box protein [Rubrobacter sp.]
MEPSKPDPNIKPDVSSDDREAVGPNGFSVEGTRFLRSILQNSSEIVKIVDPDGTLKYASPAFGRVLGYDLQETLGTNILDHVHPEDLPRVLAESESALSEGGIARNVVEYRFRHKDGSWRWLESVVTNLLDEPGVGELVVNSRDVTGRKRAERALKVSEQRFKSSFQDAPVGMALVGIDGRFLQGNRALCGIVGLGEEELLTKTFADVTHPEDVAADLVNLRRMLAGDNEAHQVEKRYVQKDGHTVWAFLSASLVRDEDGEPLYFVSQIQDFTERKALGEQLRHRALHDPLTELPNRQLFVDRLMQAFRRTGRETGRKVAVLFMDLDGFKVINDSLGHRTGDLLLVVVSQRLRRCLRPEDTLARFGGDEFVVLLEEVEGPEDALRVAERIAEELRSPFVVDGRDLFVSISTGIALGDARRIRRTSCATLTRPCTGLKARAQPMRSSNRPCTSR